MIHDLCRQQNERTDGKLEVPLTLGSKGNMKQIRSRQLRNCGAIEPMKSLMRRRVVISNRPLSRFSYKGDLVFQFAAEQANIQLKQ